MINDQSQSKAPLLQRSNSEDLRIARMRQVAQEILNCNQAVTHTIGCCLGEGGNSTCYAIQDDPTLVVLAVGTTGFSVEGDKALAKYNRLMHLQQKIPADVQIARIIQAIQYEGKVVVIEEKAKGTPLHDRRNTEYARWSSRLSEIANIPQQHFSKLVSDLLALRENGIGIDPSKPDNFFYDAEVGFTVIDWKQGSLRLDTLFSPIINSAQFFNRFLSEVTDIDGQNIRTILAKLQAAGAPQDNEYLRQIESCFRGGADGAADRT